MAHFLPPAIMAFFKPPAPLPFKKPVEPRKMYPYAGVSQFLERFKDPIPEPVKNPTPQEVRDKRKQVKLARRAKRLKIHIDKWDPKQNPNTTKDAYKTLFVGRLSYDLTEDDIKNEFEFYGPVKQVKLVRDKNNKSRGYGFVEFESSRDMKEAYNDADGRKINNRRIVVDVERGRTVLNWKPRRLGGGLGATRVGSPAVNQKYSGRQQASTDDRDRDRGDRDRGDKDRDRDRDRDRGDRDRDRGRDKERDKKEHGKERRRSRSRSRDRDRTRDREQRDRRSRSPKRRR